MVKNKVKKNKKALVSIVTVSFNAVAVIEKTILSIINQTYPNIEYIIIDGGSTDGTVDIIKKYSDKIAYWVSEPDSGIYNAMNKGIQVASGDWINFMNAGDLFFDNSTISRLHLELLDDSNIKVVYGDNMRKRKGKVIYRKSLSPKSMYRRVICCHQSVFFSLFDKQEVGYDESFILASDYNLLYDLYQKYGFSSFCYKPFPVSVYDADFGVSSVRRQLLMKEQLKIRSREKGFWWIIDYIRYVKMKILGSANGK